MGLKGSHTVGVFFVEFLTEEVPRMARIKIISRCFVEEFLIYLSLSRSEWSLGY